MRTGVPVTYVLPDWLRHWSISVLSGNELRAISPVFISAFILIVLSSFVPTGFGGTVALLGYAFGCAGIGAMAFGHDFSHRTLVTTLAQPVSRGDLWRTRMKMVIAAILPLVLVASFFLGISRLFWGVIFPGGDYMVPFNHVLFIVPLLSGICIAPWLALLFRSPLAGTVFTLLLPFILFKGIEFVGQIFAKGGAEPSVPTWRLFPGIFLGICVFGLLAGRRCFEHLEALEAVGGGSFASLKAAPRRAVTAEARPARRRGVWQQLGWKEFRLQTVAIVPAIGMMLTAYSFKQSGFDGLGRETILLSTIFWAVALCVLVGAIGSAEERQLGVLDTQALFPISTARQWLLKVVMLTFVVELLAVALPLSILASALGHTNIEVPAPQWWILGAFSLLVVSLYVSSSSRTTMNAVLISLPIAAIAMAIIALMAENEDRLIIAGKLLFPPEVRPLFFGTDRPGIYRWLFPALVAPYLFGGFFLVTALFYAKQNHFSAERGRPDRLGQTLKLLGVLLVGLIFCFSLSVRAVGSV